MNEAQKLIIKKKVSGMVDELQAALMEIEKCEINLLHAKTSYEAVLKRKEELEEGL